MSGLTLCFFVSVFVIGWCSARPDTDHFCIQIGGTCQDAYLFQCTDDNTYYHGLCAGPRNRYCCARKTDDSRCRSRGGQCDYKCEGALAFPGLCDGHMSCCIAMV